MPSWRGRTPLKNESVDFLATTPPSTELRAGFETPPEEGGSSGRTVGSSLSQMISVRAEEAPSFQGPSRSPARDLPTVPNDEGSRDTLGRLSLLASALAGRTLQVVCGEPGEPPWTDGRVVFVDAGISRREQVEAVAVQASLLAAGSLETDVVRRLTRRPALARRYLALEGHRALAAIEDLLPPPVGSLIDANVASRADSPAASLATALSRETIADPPVTFGTIRAQHLLASINRAERSATTRQHVPREQRNHVLAELAEDEEDDDGTAADLSSIPVGGGGALGRLLGQLLKVVRQLSGGSPPGADAPTHRTRAGTWGSRTVFSTGVAGPVEEAAIAGRGTKYPEWDVHRRRYRQDWCTVQEVEPRPKDGTSLCVSDGYGLRRPLARLGMGLDRCHRRVQGDDIDIDAAIEARVGVMAGSAPDEGVYIESLRRRRDLAVLLLLDISGSAAEPGATGQTVHEQQRAAATALTVALHDLGDRVALYAYHSQGRSAVHLVPVKRFDEELNTLVMRRLHGLVPCAYSRLGAAIRHGAAVLEDRGGTSRRLLVVLSDGLAYDHGYEPVYGAADARRALAEARRRGTGCLCLSIGASTDPNTLRRVFGSAAHATIPRTEQLREVIGPLFRAALRSVEVRRPVS
jgi:nitric oxide reductase NorD protein